MSYLENLCLYVSFFVGFLFYKTLLFIIMKKFFRLEYLKKFKTKNALANFAKAFACFYLVYNLFLIILPETVFGKLSQKAITLGYLYGAVFSLT